MEKVFEEIFNELLSEGRDFRSEKVLGGNVDLDLLKQVENVMTESFKCNDIAPITNDGFYFL